KRRLDGPAVGPDGSGRRLRERVDEQRVARKLQRVGAAGDVDREDRALARDPSVTTEGREALIAALGRADLAKFARFEDEVAEAKGILREARSVSGRLVASRAGGP
ncbi:MAG TPA: hypothetical protein VK527_02365, partial [Candidatus Limnocylindrales bacterium]|nr:hypothetical protein [Candidatus Limnocylindrales bacterium]